MWFFYWNGGISYDFEYTKQRNVNKIFNTANKLTNNQKSTLTALRDMETLLTYKNQSFYVQEKALMRNGFLGTD